MDLRTVERLIQGGESETLEFKRSTAQLPRAGETLCAFLNGEGGRVVIGVTPEGRIVGQEVADRTQQDIARVLDRFEPPAPVEHRVVPLPDSGSSVIVLEAPKIADGRPFTYDGRPYQHVGTATSRMPQDRYERLLLDRAHARRLWENQPAVGVALEDLDHEEILQTREAAVRQRRISAGTSTDVGDILDRLGLRRDGVLTQAAQMLYGTRFLPDYPQGRLKLGRFRGTKITGEIIDNRQEYLHAFAMVREAMAFLDRTLPLSARFTEGRIEREDRLPVPPDALREILLNAVMHRDYARAGGHVAIAVFDDRIEIRSDGGLPPGITAEMLSASHPSVLRNPLIAETFHRTGAVEAWGRGTNRVIEECLRWGIDPPSFEERGATLVVTFHAGIAQSREATTEATTEVSAEAATEVSPEARLIRALVGEMSRQQLQRALGLKNDEHFRKAYLQPALDAGLIERTIPEKPRSPKQRYRITDAGRRAVEAEEWSGE